MSTVIDAEPDAQLPDRFEVVHGEVVEIPPMSGFASAVANRINRRLMAYGEQRKIGWPWMDMIFHVPQPDDPTRNRKPDVAFITFDRWPEDRPLPYRGNAVDVVPNLVVEVASPTDDAEDLIAKAHEYLRAGTQLVWVVFPRVRQLYAYTAVGTAPRVYTEADTLDAGDVLPGFSTPLAPLFPIPIDLPEIRDDS
jgi:Uma2 family endonuclease